MRRVIILVGLIAEFALGVPSGATAYPVSWKPNDVTFDDGGTAYGTFTTDLTTGNVLGFDIVTTPGSTLNGFSYNAGTSYLYGNDVNQPNSFIIANSGNPFFIPYMQLTFEYPLTGGLAVDPIIPGNPPFAGYSFECNNCNPYRFVESGYATAPEPSTFALIGSALIALAAIRRHKRAAKVDPSGQSGK